MSKLDELLAIEEDFFRQEERILRHFAIHVRGLRDEHIEPLLAMHLNNCSEYYLEHGTIDGTNSPWMTRNWRTNYGEKGND